MLSITFLQPFCREKQERIGSRDSHMMDRVGPDQDLAGAVTGTDGGRVVIALSGPEAGQGGGCPDEVPRRADVRARRAREDHAEGPLKGGCELHLQGFRGAGVSARKGAHISRSAALPSGRGRAHWISPLARPNCSIVAERVCGVTLLVEA